jgi:hypothetical protein
MRIATFVLWSALVAGAAPALAQDQEQTHPPATGLEVDRRSDELAAWLRDYQEWEQWFEQWGNRVARNFNGNPVWKRRPRPEPPVWLEQACQGFFEAAGPLTTACEILRNWDDQPLHIVQRRRTSLVTSGGQLNDKVVKSSFLRRVHLTGLWAHARYPAAPLYGIVGMQVAVIEMGRYTLPAIGVMLVMVPDGNGGHDWKPATTLGFGFRLFDFVPPVINKRASLHFNLARTNIHGVQDDRLPGGMTVNFFGLSVSSSRR